MGWEIWVGIAAFLILAELFLPGWFLIPFISGALAAAVWNAVRPEDGLTGQLIAFSILCISFFVVMFLLSLRKQNQTEKGSLQGHKGVMIDAVSPGQSGIVKLDEPWNGSRKWSAQSVNPLAEATRVVVRDIQGITLEVEEEGRK